MDSRQFRLKPKHGKHRITGGDYVIKVTEDAYTLLVYMFENSDESIKSIASKAIEYAYKDLIIDEVEDRDE